MGKTSRNKGAGYEREVAGWFRAGGLRARRGVRQSQDKAGEPDVVLEDIDLLWVEAKRGGPGDKPYPALAQANLVCGPKRRPVFVGRPDSKPSIAAMYLEDFIWLVGRAFPDAKGKVDAKAETEVQDGDPDDDGVIPG